MDIAHVNHHSYGKRMGNLPKRVDRRYEKNEMDHHCRDNRNSFVCIFGRNWQFNVKIFIILHADMSRP